MIITFEIKQNLQQIIKECHTSKYWSFHKGTKADFYLVDRNFTQSAAECYIKENTLTIKTAWSGYTYIIKQRGDGIVYVTYNGPLKGFMQQSLLPTLTPTEGIYERLVYSTKEGWLRFREYLDKRNWNLR